ncbi:hypothetical protein MRS44_014000 [Fusarium solani]|uniref:uncharacterized protein n=1 Tax=Fusarium solani TaxID=169388 RepID=UPI0032C3F52E|nr:hypothetical protein MRS44_014000 [Fusarium solani]
MVRYLPVARFEEGEHGHLDQQPLGVFPQYEFGDIANRSPFTDFGEACIWGLLTSCSGSLASALAALVVCEKTSASGDLANAMSPWCRKITDIFTDWGCLSVDDRDGSDGDSKNYL